MQSRAPFFEQRRSIKVMGDSKDVVKDTPKRVVGVIDSWHRVVWVVTGKKRRQTYQPRPMSKRWQKELNDLFKGW